jgi:endonuclease I
LFTKAKKRLVKLYETNVDAKTFNCGCDIQWKRKKGITIPQSCG